MTNVTRILARRWRGIACGAALLAVLSCGSSTSPDGDPTIEISYSPTAPAVTLTAGGALALRTTVTGTAQAVIAWSLDGVVVAEGAVYDYQAASVGVDTVTVTVQAGDVQGGRRWIMTVVPDETQLPPAANGTTVGHGPLPAEVQVSWLRPTPTHYPIVDYLVACSYEEPLTVVNWDQAIQLGTVAHDPGVLLHKGTYGEADGMIPGATAWFAVRSRDTLGQLSPIRDVPTHAISYAWSLNLDITDDTGLPMFNAIVRYDGDLRVASDEQGLARIGPLRSIDTVTFNTITDLIDYGTGPIGVRSDTIPVTLLTWHALDHEPCTVVDPDFLAFLRRMTLTDGIGGASTVLRKWDHYPLSVWIQPGVSPNQGWDLDALASVAPGIWNAALGEPYFTTAADSLAADVVVVFRELQGENYNGLTSVLLPGGNLGDEIPAKMLVEVRPSLDINTGGTVEPLEIMITEVTLHELGHVLGFYSHICDTGQGNLMDYGGAIGSLDGGAAAVFHQDELNLVRAVRHLPQGTDMSRYLRN